MLNMKKEQDQLFVLVNVVTIHIYNHHKLNNVLVHVIQHIILYKIMKLNVYHIVEVSIINIDQVKIN